MDKMSTSRDVNNFVSEKMPSVNSPFEVMTKEKNLQTLTFLDCVVLSPSLYMLI